MSWTRQSGACRTALRWWCSRKERVPPWTACGRSAEASGLARFTAEQRADTAVVLETVRGCLESDLEFAAALALGTVLGPLFPYTLPSTCLGEVALRHGLRGPTLCLSTANGPTGAALWQARALIEEGEASHAVAACVEVLARGVADAQPALRATLVCIGPHDPAAAIARWPERDEDAFAVLAAAAQRSIDGGNSR